jgi:hypothetical protein
MQEDSEINAVIEDPCTSNWLRTSLVSALNRDCVDAANDAEILSGLLNRLCAEIHSVQLVSLTQ